MSLAPRLLVTAASTEHFHSCNSLHNSQPIDTYETLFRSSHFEILILKFLFRNSKRSETTEHLATVFPNPLALKIEASKAPSVVI